MAKKFRSMDGRRVPDLTLTHLHEEGDFSFLRYDTEDLLLATGLVYRPPGMDMMYTAWLTTDPAKQDKVGDSGTYWWWNGDEEKPTLRPSIGVPANPPYQWHGYLRDGRWEACE